MNQSVSWYQRLWTAVWKSALFFILWGLLLAPFIAPFTGTINQFRQTHPLQLQLFFEVVGFFTILIAAWLMAHFIDHRPFETLGFSGHKVIRDFLLGLCLGTGWLALSLALLWVTGHVQLQADAAVSGSFVAWTAAALLLNTVSQEVLARSYIFQTIRSQTNATAAVIVTAVLFSAYHAGAFHGSWLPALNVFLAGVLFGIAYQLSGNLWLPIGIHFIWNFLVGPILGLAISGNSQVWSQSHVLTLQGPAWLAGGAFGLEGGIAVTATTLIGIVVLVVLFRTRLTGDK